MFGHTAGHDACEMCKIRGHINADAVKADASANPNAQGRNLILTTFTSNPNPNTVFAAFADNIERCKCSDYPIFQPRHKGPHIAATLF